MITRQSAFFLPGSKIKVQKHTLTSTLAWAARKGVPFHVALSSLAKRSIKLFSIRGIKPFFSGSVVGATKDLEMGYSLSNVLEKHFRWWLPKYYIKAVQTAEEEGCLTETLQLLADASQTHDGRKREVMTAMFYPFMVAFCMVYLLLSLSMTILPKFRLIFMDLTEGQMEYNVPFLVQLFSSHPILIFLILLHMPILFYLTFYTNYLNKTWVRIPVFRRVILKWNKLEAIQGLSVFLKMGKTLPEALDLVIENQMNNPVKFRLIKIREMVEDGVPVEKAWAENFPNDPLEVFYINNGVKSDSLTKSLDSLANYKGEVLSSNYKSLVGILEPALLAVIGIFGGTLVYSIHKVLNVILQISLERVP